MKKNTEKDVDALCEKVINAIQKKPVFNKESLLEFLKKEKYKEPYEIFIFNLISFAAWQGKQEYIQNLFIHDCFDDVKNYYMNLNKEALPDILASLCLLSQGINDLGFSKVVPFVKDEWLMRAYDDAQTDDNLLIVGETGTGKQAMAETIHIMSERRKLPFEEFNCVAIPEGLLESELFGHDKGAFTGAVRETVGKLESAKSGTVFLDELGKMPQYLQAKILKVMDVKFITPVGSLKRKPIKCRFIGAVQPDDIKNKKILPDLLYRFGAPVYVHMPNLRERMAINPYMVVESSLQKAKKRLKYSGEIKFNDQLILFLQKHNYPGNYRELENILRYGIQRMIKANRIKLLPEDITPLLSQEQKASGDTEKADAFADVDDMPLKDVVNHAEAAALKLKESIVRRKLEQVKAAGGSVFSVLAKEGVEAKARQNIYKKIVSLAGKLRDKRM